MGKGQRETKRPPLVPAQKKKYMSFDLETCTSQCLRKYQLQRHHYVKRVRMRSFSSPYFPALGLNTETYGVSHLIQSGCGKYGPEKLRIRTYFTRYPFKTLSNICDKPICGNSLQLLTINCFHHKAPSQIFGMFPNKLLCWRN